MKNLILSTLLITTGLQAQLMVDDIPEKDRATTDAQGARIFKALRAVNFEAKKVVYPIYAGRERIAYGISLGENLLLTKASEVVTERAIFTASRENEALAAKVIGTYPEEDLAIVEVAGLQAAPVKWAEAESLDEGAILAAIRADGEAQAMGVLSVKERSLKSEDQGFLGIRMDPREIGQGVRVEHVEPRSAAAEAGIKVGDVIKSIDSEKVKGSFELSTRLRRMKSGDQPEIELLRAGKDFKVKPKLREREIDETQSRRLERMDRMSGSQSRVRGDFRSVIQSDMELESSHAGLPVVDLEGRIVGMVIARAGRISTLILPGDEIEEVLRKEVTPFVPNPQAERRVRPRILEGDQRDVMSRELEMMRRMMERLQRRLEGE